ncbi:MAG: TRZ/ATZ family hydrolase [Proteobacteria bacterium]|nr:TRZ/ATZ family hydrolase [Pseudomonadota bacterium]HQR02987.1 TRZ/ATZ family hydrolase [Rhodocyclaceae bacterium]
MSPLHAPPSHTDLVIRPRWMIPIEPAGVVLENHALVVNQGRIVSLLPAAEVAERYHPASQMDLPDHVLIPGMVNLHAHAAMNLLRGYADDLPLMRWLEEKIWPAEKRLLRAEFVRDGTFLAGAEMLRGGITCFNDMYFFPDAAASAIRRLGLRAVLGLPVMEFPTPYAHDAGDYLAKGIAIRDQLRQEPLLGFTLAPHAPYTVSDPTLERIATLSAQLDLPVHIHLHETRQEVDDSLREHGVRPLSRLHRLGLLGPQLIAAHGVHLNDAELALLAEQGCTLAHCPTSNMKLASGAAPVAASLDRGIRVGLGTDGAASNNRLDMFQEMRHAALLGKLFTGNAAALSAHQVLRMATLGGASALGMEDEIGSLQPGKWADLCAVRLDEWIMSPCFDPAAHLVYVAGREQVSHVWIAGAEKLQMGIFNDIRDAELREILALWQNRVHPSTVV